MKASVQYNDFVGTSAADISDFQDLYGYLEQNGVDTGRYRPIGVEFYTGNTNDVVYFSVICIDNEGERTKAVKISFEHKTIQDVISLFKRLDIVFTQSTYTDYELVDEPVMSIG